MTQENLYMPDCIRTVSGKYVNVFEPTEDMFCIEDIAHGLSMMPRFGGHLPVWYSVADHCIQCCKEAQTGDKLAALLHDASEAYLIDVPSPIKKRLSNYYEIEGRIMKMLSDKFCFTYPLLPKIAAIDTKMLEAEWQEIMLGNYREAHTPEKSKAEFLQLYRSLTTQQKEAGDE